MSIQRWRAGAWRPSKRGEFGSTTKWMSSRSGQLRRFVRGRVVLIVFGDLVWGPVSHVSLWCLQRNPMAGELSCHPSEDVQGDLVAHFGDVEN
ncbi:hypothetical protein BIW11_04278 [Tropilaelaps mercedesae]|uniref:Uncharacterized protein n=1 Tax=Tropilaelaps mercedesae TaxID=418985 RepID=A0A1V9X8I9_9ACAR|nr:hypothetical protein BIW11_04278 [Tropilaelaps mercedesae]